MVEPRPFVMCTRYPPSARPAARRRVRRGVGRVVRGPDAGGLHGARNVDG